MMEQAAQAHDATSIEIHPIADILPLLGEQDLASLAEDIGANGLRTPIAIWGGKVIDGRNRLRACQLAGVEPSFEQYEFDDEAAAARHVMSLNLVRRHLTAAQRADVATRLLPIIEQAAKAKESARKSQNQDGSTRESIDDCQGDLSPGSKVTSGSGENLEKIKIDSSAEAAKMTGSSRASVARMKRIQLSGVPELVEMVRTEAVGMKDAADVVKLPAPEQRDLCASGPEVVKRRAAELRAQRKAERDAERIVVQQKSDLSPGSKVTELTHVKDGGNRVEVDGSTAAPEPVCEYDDPRDSKVRGEENEPARPISVERVHNTCVMCGSAVNTRCCIMEPDGLGYYCGLSCLIDAYNAGRTAPLGGVRVISDRTVESFLRALDLHESTDSRGRRVFSKQVVGGLGR